MKINEKKYLGGLVVTVYAHGKPKQVRRRITGVNSIREAVNVATS